ncbi:hypothetical protein HQ576_04190 [bacterium]|nr:hypothetical protein [bacterium]
MTYKGHVEKGVIVLDEPAKLPEGAAVEVQPAPQTKQQHEREADVPTLYERLKPFIGMVKDGPPDASVNYEHHLYGLPKQK